jgi:outer membrane protein insertion porin family
MVSVRLSFILAALILAVRPSTPAEAGQVSAPGDGSAAATRPFQGWLWPGRAEAAQDPAPGGGAAGASQEISGWLWPGRAEAAQNPAAAGGQPPAPPPAAGATICGQPVPPPANLPPAGSGPVLWVMAPCFEAQGNVSLVDIQTYLYYIQLKDKLSRPSQNYWVPYDESIEQIIRDDFQRLWATNFLDDIRQEYEDYTFSNGVVGRMVTYHLEERQRIRTIDYVGSKQVERTKIEERLKEMRIELRLDSFIDPAIVKKIEGVVREMLKEKGFQFSGVTHKITEVAGGPKLVNLVFNLDEGPKVKIRTIEFDGNQVAGDRTLRRRMKTNKIRKFLPFFTSHGTYQEAKFEEDADRVMQYYLDRGYINAQVGTPELKFADNPSNKKTRWVDVRIPVREGNRYRIGNLDFDGNTIVKTEALRPLFKLTPGEFYSHKEITKGFQKAQEVYGAAGYMEFTGYPEPKPRDAPNPAVPEAPAALAAEPKPAGPPIVDLTLRIQEGKQYFVNRIVFVGNTTTRDSVIRREMRLYENGVFNSEALKYSIRRLNQLGYFKALEGPPKDVTVDKTTGQDTRVDVRLQLQEQNRNQLTFGAGVSQYEGFFGQLSFQTSNFLGRGESLTVAVQAGSRAQNYTLAFTEPFLFDRNITGGVNLFKSEVRYIGQFTQESVGGVLTFGFPIGNGFTRMFANYSYEQTKVSEINAAFCDPLLLARNPFLRDSLLLSGANCGFGVGTTTEINPLTGEPITVPIAGGSPERRISKVVPSLVYNTVDQPIFPTTGRRVTASFDVAGLGGNTNFLKPTLEGVWFLRQNARMSFGMRGQVEYIRTYGSTIDLPIFQKLFLGGEYSVRGFDIRSIGPQDLGSGLVLGGNKSLLFNVEQIITIAGPVRLILFYDAGQVRDIGQAFALKEDRTERVPPPRPPLFDPFASVSLTDPNAPGIETVVVGRQSAFKTSTGAEIRFFMPVLNVPFRLIFAYNPQRHGVLDNRLQPQKAFQFRFAVGTTF